MIVASRGLHVSLRERQTEGWRSDIAAFFQVFFAGEYDFLLSRISPGDTVIDAGANIGCFSLLAARRVGPNGLVIAVEPEPANARCLRVNIELNKLRNVLVIEKALGGRSNESANMIGTGGAARMDPAGISITTVTLDDVCNDTPLQRVDIIKMDVEGAEEAIVAAPSTSIVLGTVKALAVEVHDSAGAEVVQTRLRAEGYSFISGIKREHEFIANGIRQGVLRPDVVIGIYRLEIVCVVARLVSGFFQKRRQPGQAAGVGLIYAER